MCGLQQTTTRLEGRKNSPFLNKNLNKRQVHENKNNWKDRSLDHDSSSNSPVIYKVAQNLNNLLIYTSIN